ncbi:hypothetical protein L211DRAFT_879868 [Terfezia boudieri ATCC MYA-4762]|uniref:Uncharacterized protein n=1 Tax=Terfezia boudieri ATCC MYA-4762 TaxID=1051890 RepID=A0A3N4M1N7_9PEZI|nr:hypothetical protein L211DRAFT_879868 [Terfezia boudieri ATCC MYA-4762]
MGKRLCAGLVSKLEGDAKKWLEDYQSQKKPIPNCWKKHADMEERVLRGNGDVVETSLFDLLQQQFSGEVDARTTEVELKKYKWEPFKKGGQLVTGFKTHIERLMKRAQKTGSFERIHYIRNVL